MGRWRMQPLEIALVACDIGARIRFTILDYELELELPVFCAWGFGGGLC